MYDKGGKPTVMTLEQLLPMSFGPEKLLTTEERIEQLHMRQSDLRET